MAGHLLPLPPPAQPVHRVPVGLRRWLISKPHHVPD